MFCLTSFAFSKSCGGRGVIASGHSGIFFIQYRKFGEMPGHKRSQNNGFRIREYCVRKFLLSI